MQLTISSMVGRSAAHTAHAAHARSATGPKPICGLSLAGALLALVIVAFGPQPIGMVRASSAFTTPKPSPSAPPTSHIHSATGPTNTRPPTESSSTLPAGFTSAGVECQSGRQFRCELEDRCIPIEWHCDFVEQCVGGQDELGCVADWCDFRRDNCFWVNSLVVADGSNESSATPAAAALDRRLRLAAPADKLEGSRPQLVAVRQSFWRRYFGHSDSEPRQHQHPVDQHQQRPRQPRASLAQLLANLSTRGEVREESAKFIFVPLSLSEVGQLVKIARLATPPVGRTASTCQLRFEYSLHTVEPPTNLSAAIITTLSLYAKSENLLPRRLVWSRTIERRASLTTAMASSKLGALNRPEAASGPHWLPAVAELGHLRQARLSFEVRMEAMVGTRSSAPGRNESAFNGFAGSLVALRWLGFHECRWPRGDSIESQLSAGPRSVDNGDDYDDYLADPISQLDDWTPGRGVDSATPPLLPIADGESGARCASDQFQCSSGLCLEARKLCNSVGDCMTSGATTDAHDDDETDELCDPLPGRESFDRPDRRRLQLFLTSRPERFWHLTGNWTINRVGVRNNAQHEAHLPQVDHTTHTSAGKFLALEMPAARVNSVAAGAPANWWWPPSFLGKAQNSASPGVARDEWWRWQRRPVDDAGAPRAQLYWAAINSQWMQRLPEDQGDCRLKFFVNLISASGATLAESALRLTLAIEHYTWRPPTLSSTQASPLSAPTKHIDSVLYSGTKAPVDERIGVHTVAPIELAGVDFWREINQRLVNLNAGDLFYVRLLIILHLYDRTDDMAQPPGREFSLSFDDLATHFGCGPLAANITLLERHLPKQVETLDRELLRFLELAHRGSTSSLSSTTDRSHPLPISTYNPIRNRLKRNHVDLSDWLWWISPGGDTRASKPLLSFDTPPGSHSVEGVGSQVAPQRLIAYVLGAACVMMGFIAVIVFVLVPRVERAMMNYQDHIQLSLSGEISDLPVSPATIYDFTHSTQNSSLTTSRRSLPDTGAIAESRLSDGWAQVRRVPTPDKRAPKP